MKLTIVTVCFNCLSDLRKTVSSVLEQSDCDIEYIVIDGGSSDGTKEFLENNQKISKWVSESDKGIYDAMNKGVQKSTGDAILFLNAGDYFVGDIIKEVVRFPTFIPVKTKRAGIVEMTLKPKSYKLGLPYCHQGIIFENKGILYDTSFKIAADYDFYLRHSYQNLPFLEIKSGYVYYDNFGLSASRGDERDSEILQIIKVHFGVKDAAIFFIYAKAKTVLKRLLGLLKKLKK